MTGMIFPDDAYGSINGYRLAWCVIADIMREEPTLQQKLMFKAMQEQDATDTHRANIAVPISLLESEMQVVERACITLINFRCDVMRRYPRGHEDDWRTITHVASIAEQCSTSMRLLADIRTAANAVENRPRPTRFGRKVREAHRNGL